jgi:hypothetical protein
MALNCLQGDIIPADLPNLIDLASQSKNDLN